MTDSHLTPDGISVRPAREDDADTLRRIDDATWSTAVTPGPRPDPERDFFTERHRPDDLLVAEVGGAVVGYVVVDQALPVPSHLHVLEIGGLAVDPSAQGRGVGEVLVRAAVDEAVRRGARKLTLRVLAPNVGARRLYERCGFVTEGVLVGEFLLDGVEVDDVLMAHRLD